MKPASGQNLFILSFIMLVVMLGYGIIIPILPFYIQGMGAGGLELSFLIASYSLMRLICGPLWGILSDRIGRKPVLLVGILGYTITMVWFGFAARLWMVFTARIISGMLSSATAPSALAYISDSTTSTGRSKGMGILGAAGGIGTILGPAFGGFLSDHSLALPFFIAAAFSALALLLAFFILPESLPQTVSHKASKSDNHLNFKMVLQAVRGPLGILFTLTFISTCGLMIFTSISSLYTSAKLGFGPREAGVMMMVLGCMSAVGQGLLLGSLTSRLGDSAVIRLGFLASALGFGLFLYADQYILVLLATAVFGLAFSIQIPALTALTSRKSEGSQGIAMGLSNSFISLGRIFGPLLGGILFDINLPLPYIGGGAIMVSGLIIGALALPQKSN